MLESKLRYKIWVYHCRLLLCQQIAQKSITFVDCSISFCPLKIVYSEYRIEFLMRVTLHTQHASYLLLAEW